MNDNKVANISIRGYSHVLGEKECQDNSISWQEKQYDAVIVCDGHGGDKYFRSAIGSRFACEAGKKMISAFMNYVLNNDETRINWDALLSQLEISIINEWNELVERHFLDNPFESDARFEKLAEEDKRSLYSSYVKAYGSTFIAAVLTDKHLFVLKLGDGNVCVFKDGQADKNAIFRVYIDVDENGQKTSYGLENLTPPSSLLTHHCQLLCNR